MFREIEPPRKTGGHLIPVSIPRRRAAPAGPSQSNGAIGRKGADPMTATARVQNAARFTEKMTP